MRTVEIKFKNGQKINLSYEGDIPEIFHDGDIVSIKFIKEDKTTKERIEFINEIKLMSDDDFKRLLIANKSLKIIEDYYNSNDLVISR